MLLLSCVISKATVRFFIQYLLCSNNSTTGMSSYPTLFLASRNRGGGAVSFPQKAVWLREATLFYTVLTDISECQCEN